MRDLAILLLVCLAWGIAISVELHVDCSFGIQQACEKIVRHYR